MKQQIHQLLLRSSDLTGREIAKKIGADKKAVNSFLSKNLDTFIQNDKYQWQIRNPNEIIIEFDTAWVNSQAFEKALATFPNLFENQDANIKFIIPKKCKLLLEAIAKFLALVNQLMQRNITVSIDMCECDETRNYLNRAGFFDHLNEQITVLPSRPTESLAQKHRGSSESLVEFGSIDPKSTNKALIVNLGKCFVIKSSESYEIVALTIFSELIGNVSEHSESAIEGFAALQYYAPTHMPKHIQTVISDSGLGVSATLRPSLMLNYPKLYEAFGHENVESDIGLVRETFSKGNISRFGGARGLGFKSSREQATKFNAKLSIRQETFNVELSYKDGQLYNHRIDRDLTKIHGTHICFDFMID